MPLPEKFYNLDGEEVSLEKLCFQAPEWAANRIRHLTKQIDALTESQPAVEADAPPCPACHEYNVYLANFCPNCGRKLRTA